MDKLLAHPSRALMLLCAAQLIFWTLAPALSHSAPPLDVVEMYAWGREHVVATFKHPNLPGLVLEGFRMMGVNAWQAAFIVSQLSIGLTFIAVFALGRELMDAPRALAGTLLLTGIVFFSWPTPEFNHNVAQMPLWAATAFFLWRASTRGELLSWIALGVVAGLSMWAKYSSAILLLVAGVWMLWDAEARRRLLSPGPWLALAIAAAVFAPQFLWLQAHEFQPFTYAAARAQRAGIGDALAFVPTQIVNHLPMAIVLLAAGFFGKAAEGAPPAPEKRALRYLLLMGLGPVLLTAVLGIAAGGGLKTAWGAPMLNLSGLLAIALLSHKFSAPRLKRVGVGAGVLIVAVSGLYFAHMKFGAQITGEPLRGNWPQERISRALQAAWADENPADSLRVVAGDIWTAGLVGLGDPQPPSVLINCNRDISPWVRDEDVLGGYLIVWPEGAEPPCPLQNDSAVSRLTVPISNAPDAEPLRINYEIVSPAPGF